MANEITDLPTVHQDKVSPQQAPAAWGSATAQQAEAKHKYIQQQYVPERLKQVGIAAYEQPTEESLSRQLTDTSNAVAEASDQLANAQANLAEVSKRDKDIQGTKDRLLAAFGLSPKRSPEQRQKDIEEAKILKEDTQQRLKQAQEDQARFKQAKSAVHLYPPEYFANQVGVLANLLESIQRGDVPLAVTEKMMEALAQQDLIQPYIRELGANGYEINPSKTLPFKVYQNIRQKIAAQVTEARSFLGRKNGVIALEHEIDLVPGFDHIFRRKSIEIPESKNNFLFGQQAFGDEDLKKAEIKARKAALVITTFIEEAGNYAEKEGLIATDENKALFVKNMQTFIDKGATMFEKDPGDKDGVQIRKLLAFTAGKYQGMGYSKVLLDPYVIGAFQLEGLCKELGIPEGRERVPFVLAYAAGMLSSYKIETSQEFPDTEGVIFYSWLTDVIPSTKRARVVVKDNGQYDVEETSLQTPTPLGLGWSLKRKLYIERLDTECKNFPYPYGVPKYTTESIRQAYAAYQNKMVLAINERDAGWGDGTDAKISAGNILTAINNRNSQRGLVGFDTPVADGLSVRNWYLQPPFEYHALIKNQSNPLN